MTVWWCDGTASIVLDTLAKAGIEIEPTRINCLEHLSNYSEDEIRNMDEKEFLDLENKLLQELEEKDDVYIYFEAQGPCLYGEIYKISGNLKLAEAIIDAFNSTFGIDDEQIARNILQRIKSKQ
ncbi:MAG: hypothetical protein DRH04_05675 [Deltaproteobacteria bacterium]|nr:MAG: hypothetical protein DRH04_05675 [Deltaproteobacteria bacterium]